MIWFCLLMLSEVSVEEMCKQEVIELHQFFEDWFTGKLPDTDEAFARFADAMGDDFQMVTPAGILIERKKLLPSLRTGHGGGKPGEIKIWVEDVRVRKLGPHYVATYQEWQIRGGKKTGRLSSALFRPEPGKPKGVVWLHLHETWLPAQKN